MWSAVGVFWCGLMLLWASTALSARTLNGFDLSDTRIPAAEIVSGGPPKDGIPALTNPQFYDPRKNKPNQDQLKGWVLGIGEGAGAKAYPLGILNFHELVNERLDGRAILVSYCPLCGTGIIFSREVDGRELTFGVSGLLYNNNLLMYDTQTESLWSQGSGTAISGHYAGTVLTWLSAEYMPLSDWLAKHPKSQVLSTNTGYYRDYGANPYRGYERTNRLIFPQSRNDSRYPRKEWVVAVLIDGQAKAWPYSELAQSPLPVRDRLAGIELKISYNRKSKYATVEAINGEPVAVSYSYWFAWASFFPDTQVYQATEQKIKSGLLDK